MLSMKNTYIPVNLISKILHGSWSMVKCLSIELKPKIRDGFSFHWYDKSLKTQIFTNFTFIMIIYNDFKKRHDGKYIMSKKRPFSKLFKLSAYPLFCLSNNCIEEVLMKNDYLKRVQLIACNTLILKLDFFFLTRKWNQETIYISKKRMAWEYQSQ